MKSKQKKYIRKHIGKESVEEIAQKFKLNIEIVFPLVIFLLAFNIDSFHGLLDAVESGQYLSCVNSVYQEKLPFKDVIPAYPEKSERFLGLSPWNFYEIPKGRQAGVFR